MTRDTDEWIVVNCGDVQIHLFSPETRAEYDLEGLWTKEIKDLNPAADLRALEKNYAFLMSDDKAAARRGIDPRNYDPKYDRDLFDTSDGEESEEEGPPRRKR